MNFVGETVSAKLAFESQSRCAHCDTIAVAVMYRANELEFFNMNSSASWVGPNILSEVSSCVFILPLLFVSSLVA